ncbi:methylglyoxal synthase [Streptomyces sp. NPDC020799]|uniref:methylglyoxal synthase n=1 Tax=Streptomyces sp. NPDC020799 TaxID=3365091 RepID=UPI00379CAC00
MDPLHHHAGHDRAERHLDGLRLHSLVATASTAALLGARFGLSVSPVRSGPLGGDQQLGAMIAEGRLDVLIFFSDPLAAQPHDADVRALLRVAVLHNVPTATNPATGSPPSYPRCGPSPSRSAAWQRVLRKRPPGRPGRPCARGNPDLAFTRILGLCPGDDVGGNLIQIVHNK